MGYKGPDPYADRDKAFDQSFQGRLQDRSKVKKNLDALFAPKAADPCANGHLWIRDFDRQNKCARCKTPKPA